MSCRGFASRLPWGCPRLSTNRHVKESSIVSITLFYPYFVTKPRNLTVGALLGDIAKSERSQHLAKVLQAEALHP